MIFEEVSAESCFLNIGSPWYFTSDPPFEITMSGSTCSMNSVAFRSALAVAKATKIPFSRHFLSVSADLLLMVWLLFFRVPSRSHIINLQLKRIYRPKLGGIFCYYQLMYNSTVCIAFSMSASQSSKLSASSTFSS